MSNSTQPKTKTRSISVDLMLTMLLMLLSVTAFCMSKPEAEQLFSESNSAYEKGDFQKAYDGYKLIENEFSSFELQFNLGNACLKLDKIGESVLHYERAKKINPFDEDMKTNLQMANQKVADKIEALPSLGVSDLWKNITSESALQRWAMASLILFFLGFLFLALFVLKKNLIYRRAIFLTGLFLLFTSLGTWALAGSAKQRILSNTEAVVLTPKVDVKGSPDETTATVFVLHQGTKVSIREKRDAWIEIRIANGSVGWVKAETIETI